MNPLTQLGLSKDEMRTSVEQYVKMVGLEGFERAYLLSLSDGMRMRTSIARALAVEPDILFMDELLSHLDEITARILRGEKY